jgi:hypothetical protein
LLIAPELQYFKIIAVLSSPFALKNQPYELEPGYRGSFFITFRPKQARASAAMNQKPQNFLRLIGLTISSRAMIMRFPTRLAKAGTKNWPSRACWYRVSCFERHFLIISGWTLNQENSPGIPPARRGSRKMRYMIIWC